MSRKYYYFAASLPALSMDAPPPLTMAHFLRLCDEHLDAGDRGILDQLVGPAGPGAASHAFLAAWHNIQTQILNAVARQRAARLRVDPTPYIRAQEGIDMAIEKGVADAFSKPTPQDRELALDRLRWQLVSGLAGFDPFASAAIFSYAMRLRLAERWNAMSAEQGARELEGRVAGLISAVA